MKKTLEDLEEYAKRWGWNRCGSFWDWVTLRLVGYDRQEKERAKDKAESNEFSRWFYGSRMFVMDRWMRESPNVPEEVKNQYFCIIANGVPGISDRSPGREEYAGYTALLKAADEAQQRAIKAERELTELKESK